MGIIEKIDQRLSMMGDMMTATDTDLSTEATISSVSGYRSMVSRCLNCPQPDECKTWLQEGHEHAEAPAFCPNRGILNAK